MGVAPSSVSKFRSSVCDLVYAFFDDEQEEDAAAVARTIRKTAPEALAERVVMFAAHDDVAIAWDATERRVRLKVSSAATHATDTTHQLPPYGQRLAAEDALAEKLRRVYAAAARLTYPLFPYAHLRLEDAQTRVQKENARVNLLVREALAYDDAAQGGNGRGKDGNDEKRTDADAAIAHVRRHWDVARQTYAPGVLCARVVEWCACAAWTAFLKTSAENRDADADAAVAAVVPRAKTPREKTTETEASATASASASEGSPALSPAPLGPESPSVDADADADVNAKKHPITIAPPSGSNPQT